MRTHTTAAARALSFATLLLSGCFDDKIDCADCEDDTEAPGAPALDLGETSIDFGEVRIGETLRESLGVGNTGTALLELSDIAVTEPFIARYDDGISVGTNSSAMLTIELTPTTAAELSGTLSFTWNDPDASDGGMVEVVLSASVLEDTGLD